jgi:uncharacterized protein (DUF427 family)
MSSKPVRIPGPDHPITVEPQAGRVVVRAGGKIVADTRNALKLKEASYPAVLYIPRADANMSLLERTQHATYCPYKGDCSHYSIPGGGDKARNAVWTYESPYPSVAAIAGHLAFYPDRVDSIDLAK